MPILSAPAPAPEPVVTQTVVDAVVAEMRAHCAPSTWDKAVRSLRVNGFPFKV